ncbi:3-hydroxylacyl-ACP dehydratase [Parahaliea mediterranea]|uniref:ApeP family dehydratase n=1 Tax=Parahaliea mediterranea TaxID=651086 RepID=UPI000E2F5D19|nr:3-hydroxylacyl-ACP dehydratase [Parahaliea mediterranea]
MTELPDIADIARLLPHERPMVLLDRLLAGGDEGITCEASPRDDGLFDDGDGTVPAYLGLEYMAQAVAAYSGLRAHREGRSPRLGFLLGSRHFRSNVTRLPCGQPLQVSAQQLVQSASGMASFECRVEGHNIVQSARLSVYEPADPARYLAEDGQ